MLESCCRCGLIFNVEPLEIARSQTDPTICIICEEHTMYTIEPQRVTEMRAVITLGELDITALIADPTPLINDLSILQRAWHQPAPTARKKNGAVKPVEKKSRLKKPELSCTYCGALFLTPGRHRNHEAKCIDNPDRVVKTGD